MFLLMEIFRLISYLFIIVVCFVSISLGLDVGDLISLVEKVE